MTASKHLDTLLATLQPMPMHRRQHLRAAWLALLLFALATLMPTVSRAMAHLQGQIAPWAAVCAAADAGNRGEPGDALLHLTAHCPACHLQADSMPPPSAPASLALPRAAAQPPQMAALAPAAAAPWSSGQPRAPPAPG